MLGCASANGGAPEDASPAPARGGRELSAEQQAWQALSRAAFGPRPGDVAHVEAVGVDRWIDAQLHPAGVNDAAWERIAPLFPVEGADLARLAHDYPPQNVWLQRLRRARGLPDTAQLVLTAQDSAEWKTLDATGNRLAGELGPVRVARALVTDRQLQEVMTDFWENHFSVFSGKMPNRFALAAYDRDVIRPRALGRFRDLLGAVAHSPAMLWYLDGYQSRVAPERMSLPEWRADSAARAARRPPPRRGRRGAGLNENYGRELLELHTLGVDGGYTQQDVGDVARALTGWTLATPQEGGGFVFRPELHDAEPKLVLGRRLPPGRGVEDGEEVLDVVAQHPSTARFIARKLCVRFVGDAPPPALVARAAATFRSSDGDVAATLGTILHSPEFYSRQTYRAKVKTPFELVVSGLRALNATPDTTGRSAAQVARLGEPFFGRLTPDGWPETGEPWLASGSLLDRVNFGLQLGAGRFPGASLDRWSPGWTLAFEQPSRQVDGVVRLLLGGDVAPATRAQLLGPAAPDSVRAAPLPLASLVGLALGTPEFQRR
ncbi:hypothetical protein tb265_33810 [Gemmatimonadetes bacterium T265]|nr:hypothetical protein tb265_33810 [Gemmatimonadetes bacterium T265]